MMLWTNYEATKNKGYPLNMLLIAGLQPAFAGYPDNAATGPPSLSANRGRWERRPPSMVLAAATTSCQRRDIRSEVIAVWRALASVTCQSAPRRTEAPSSAQALSQRHCSFSLFSN